MQLMKLYKRLNRHARLHHYYWTLDKKRIQHVVTNTRGWKYPKWKAYDKNTPSPFLPFWMMVWDLENLPWIAVMCKGVFPSLLWKRKKCCYLAPVTAINQIWQKNPTKRTFLSSFLSTLHPLNCFYALLPHRAGNDKFSMTWQDFHKSCS